MRLAALLVLPLALHAEIRTLTLRQAINLALDQAPEVALARLDQQKARDQVTVLRDAFMPKVYAGSGAAYTYGFPASIDGNAPAIIQAKTVMSLFDKPLSFQIAQASEVARGAEVDITLRQQEVAYRVAAMYLEAEEAARGFASAQRQVDNLQSVRSLVKVRVDEGRELPLAFRKAEVAVQRAKMNVETLTYNLGNVESALAQALGLPAGDRVRAQIEDRPSFDLPQSEEASVEQALDGSRELKRLESNLQVKTLEMKQYQAARLPKINLVAQYSLLSKYNNFQDYFARFQRHNAELGASFEIPILNGHAPKAQMSQAEADAAKLRIEVSRTRSRISSDVRRAWSDIRHAESARDLARADLDLARDQIAYDLALMEEGRLLQAVLEQDRAVENEKWIAYYQAQHALDLAKLDVLKSTGSLVAALR